MIADIRKPLFAWDEMQASPSLGTIRRAILALAFLGGCWAMQASPSLGTIRRALEAIPDAPLLAALPARRHRGCDTYPVRVL